MCSRKQHSPTGLTRCWMLWRHCCCTYGAYPALVAPIITAGFLLSLYSTAGCEFIDVEVGFSPSNTAWNTSGALLGLFYYQSGLEDNNNKYRETFHDGCRWYSDQFEKTFITPDRTWKVARFMALTSLCAGCLAMILNWFMVLTPLPTDSLWPGLLLPVVMIAFIAEGSKFLFFDIAICSNSIWYPSGVDSLPTKAKSCDLAYSSYFGIASASTLLACLLLVCLKAPFKRQLDPNFGSDFEHQVDDLETPRIKSYRSRGYDGADDSIVEDDLYTSGPGPAAASHVETTDHSSDDEYLRAHDSDDSDRASEEDDDGEFIPASSSIRYSRETRADGGERSPVEGEPLPYVSKSRLSAMDKVAQSMDAESNFMIEQFVSEVDECFDDESPLSSD